MIVNRDTRAYLIILSFDLIYLQNFGDHISVVVKYIQRNLVIQRSPYITISKINIKVTVSLKICFE